ncbi:ATP-binding protein [Streptomyces sp. DH10]|uniref:ATP-binding protein n=1 Tax=Streptomyces sp. DH10 TaxID=3040121 RepID=UPI002441B30A|nr:ATP-binding protein [Streptomyces sp. DH10]MDG9709685.1 ATP-binding protein [Streptomyces sp. DH10]
MTATVYGTGTLHAVAVDARPCPTDPVPDLVVHEYERGFRADLTASREAVSGVRALTRRVRSMHGTDLAESAELVVSELMGNAVRASDSREAVPLVVEVHAAQPGIEVIVHDTVPGQPNRGEAALDSAEAESGRGLGILDALTDRWSVEPSTEPSFTKMIRCLVSRAE